MITINKDSKYYPVVADTISAIIGTGASMIVRSFCNAIVDTCPESKPKKSIMKLGIFGLETVTLYDVASEARSTIDSLVDGYNDLAQAINEYNEYKNDPAV